ncbi:uncharacterized protein G2W53_016319 [Senna tora]|uniref:Uncharacterized protein n=1 Tax=Senna tora TaxID=362788 RepID=A0A834WJ84_9FABA|nr:uncharacterized protein G2W53_016319 [Senna tora]
MFGIPEKGVREEYPMIVEKSHIRHNTEMPPRRAPASTGVEAVVTRLETVTTGIGTMTITSAGGASIPLDPNGSNTQTNMENERQEQEVQPTIGTLTTMTEGTTNQPSHHAGGNNDLLKEELQ